MRKLSVTEVGILVSGAKVIKINKNRSMHACIINGIYILKLITKLGNEWISPSSIAKKKVKHKLCYKKDKTEESLFK